MKIVNVSLSLWLLCASVYSMAQSNLKVRFEEVKKKCEGQDKEKKIKVALARFNVTTPACTREFGANMATMLTNALQETNCYRVLAQLSNLEDLKGEIAFNKSDDASGENGPESGKMMSAQLVVTGEITEYSVKESTGAFTIIKGASYVVKIGFVLQIINPETRELISKSINVEAKMASGIVAGTFLPYVGNINLAGASKRDVAIANTLEKGILEAVEFMSQDKDRIAQLAPGANNTAAQVKTTVLTITYCDFPALSAFAETIGKISIVTDVQKALKEGVATIKVKHADNTDAFMAAFLKLAGDKVEVIDFSEGKVTLRKF